jgi:hypothetical protein
MVTCFALQGKMEGESQADSSTIWVTRTCHLEKETLEVGVLPEPGKLPLGSVSQSGLGVVPWEILPHRNLPSPKPENFKPNTIQTSLFDWCHFRRTSKIVKYIGLR